MGLKLTSLMIFMHSISNPLPFSKGEVYKRDDRLSCKAVQFFVVITLGFHFEGLVILFKGLHALFLEVPSLQLLQRFSSR